METQKNKGRTVEIFAGAYACGKSEISINRALELNNENTPVTLVDLDTVEPAYTLRPLKKTLEKYGIRVVTQEDSFGLGETGNVITPAQKNALKLYPNDNIIIDVGYGAGGLEILNLVTGLEEEQNANIFIVINASKYETSTVENIVEYINASYGSQEKNRKKIDGIISNTHFGDETEPADVIKGYEITVKAGEILDIPVTTTAVSESVYSREKSLVPQDIPVLVLKRFMPNALW